MCPERLAQLSSTKCASSPALVKPFAEASLAKASIVAVRRSHAAPRSRSYCCTDIITPTARPLPGHAHGRALRGIEQVAEAILGFSGRYFLHVARIAKMASNRNSPYVIRTFGFTSSMLLISAVPWHPPSLKTCRTGHLECRAGSSKHARRRPANTDGCRPISVLLPPCSHVYDPHVEVFDPHDPSPANTIFATPSHQGARTGII